MFGAWDGGANLPLLDQRYRYKSIQRGPSRRVYRDCTTNRTEGRVQAPELPTRKIGQYP